MSQEKLNSSSSANEFFKWLDDTQQALASKGPEATLDPDYLNQNRSSSRKDSIAKLTIMESLAYELYRNLETRSMSASTLFSAIQSRFKPKLTCAAREAMSELYSLK